MDGIMLLHRAREAGLKIEVEGDKLIVRGPRRLEPLARRLLDRKPEILAALGAGAGAGETPAPAAHEIPPPVPIREGPYRGFYLSPPDRRPDPERARRVLEEAERSRASRAEWLRRRLGSAGNRGRGMP